MAARTAQPKERLGATTAARDVVEQPAPGLAKRLGRAASAAVTAAPRASRGAVDAPGKRHRKPPPQEHLDPRMGEPVGKKMGQKSPKGRIRSGRG